MKKSLDDITPMCKAHFALALESVVNATGVSKKKIFSKARQHEVIAARYMIYKLMDITDRYDLGSIGANLDKDHSSVLHGIREHATLYSQNYMGHATYFDVAKKEFLLKFNQEAVATNKNEADAYEILIRLDELINGLNVVRDAITEDYLRGNPINQELKEKLTKAMFVPDPSDHTTELEKDIATKFWKNDKDQSIDD